MTSSCISVRIMGVPERIDCIRRNQKILMIPDEQVFIDEEHKGVMFNAKRAWLYETESPFTMVLQDDVELCNNFMSYCERIAATKPTEIIGLFPIQLFRAVAGSLLPKKSPYILVDGIGAPGILMPTGYVKPCMDSWDSDALGDDGAIARWARENNVNMLTTVPALIQHVGEVSVFNPERSFGGTPYFNRDPKDANWDCGYVTSITNIIR